MKFGKPPTKLKYTSNESPRQNNSKNFNYLDLCMANQVASF
jgi:hypothetical protein